MIPTRREKWYSNPQNQQELFALLQSPVFQAAVAVLDEDMRPVKDTTERASADALTRSALQFEHLTGFHEALQRLADLAAPEPKGPQGAPDAYSEDHVKQYAKDHGIEIPEGQ